MYSANVGLLLQLTCSSNKQDSCLQHKTTMSSSSISKAMHEIILNKLCLMHDHTFCKLSFVKLSFIKLSFRPLKLVCIVRFCHETMPAGLSLLKISHGLSSSQPSPLQGSLLTLFHRCLVELKTIRQPFIVVFFLYLIWKRKTRTWQLSDRSSDLPSNGLPL